MSTDFSDFKASGGLVYFTAARVGPDNRPQSGARRFAADGRLPMHKVVNAAAAVMGGRVICTLSQAVSDKPDGAHILTDREVEAA